MLINAYSLSIVVAANPATNVTTTVGPVFPGQGTIERISVKCTDGTNGGATYNLAIWTTNLNTTAQAASLQQIIFESGITASGVAAVPASGTPDFVTNTPIHFVAPSAQLSAVSPVTCGAIGSASFTIFIETGGGTNGKTFEVGLIIRSPEVAFQKDGESYALLQRL